MNEIICGDNLEVMEKMKEGCVDLTVTSPPYDDLRTYNNNIDKTWGEDLWKPIIEELYRVTKKGGVVVWVVGDRTHKGSESGTSFNQALWFMDCGFKLYDTMIYKKVNPLPSGTYRYIQSFEYMFVFSRDKPKTFNPILQDAKDYRKNGKKSTARQVDGTLKNYKHNTNRMVIKQNVFEYKIGLSNTTNDKIAFKHPAMFPEKLAEDHIISWSNPNDIVFDPFVGSGTTPKMAKKLGRRYIGIDISEEYCELARERIGLV